MRLQRTDGNLVRKFKIDAHHENALEGELWWYGFGDLTGKSMGQKEFIAWYKSGNEWKILVAGPEAYRRYGDGK